MHAKKEKINRNPSISSKSFVPSKNPFCTVRLLARIAHGAIRIFPRSVPEGRPENSPAFQRRVVSEDDRVPTGRLRFGRPFGTCWFVVHHPALKRRAILRRPFGTLELRQL